MTRRWAAALFFIAPLTGILNPTIVFAESSASLRINEVQASSASSAADEFVELFNAGSAAASLDAWKLTTRTSGGTEMNLYSDFSGLTIEPGQFLVIANPGFLPERSEFLRYSNKSAYIAQGHTLTLYSDKKKKTIAEQVIVSEDKKEHSYAFDDAAGALVLTSLVTPGVFNFPVAPAVPPSPPAPEPLPEPPPALEPPVAPIAAPAVPAPPPAAAEPQSSSVIQKAADAEDRDDTEEIEESVSPVAKISANLPTQTFAPPEQSGDSEPEQEIEIEENGDSELTFAPLVQKAKAADVGSIALGIVAVGGLVVLRTYRSRGAA